MGKDVYIAFKHFNNSGDGLYIDDVKIGTRPAADIMVKSHRVNTIIASGSTVIPKTILVNNGSATQTFDVTTTITPGGYTATQTIIALKAGLSDTVDFSTWTPSSSGTYTIKTYAQLAGDANIQNDTITTSLSVLDIFTNEGWVSKPNLPAGRWATGPVFAKPCVSDTDTGFVYLVSGGDAAFANSTLNSVYNTTLGTWSTRAPIPVSRTQVTPVVVNNKIYVIGGYGSSFSPITSNNIYDITSNTWTTGMALPKGVGDYGIGVYNDSLIYIVGGYNGSNDINEVQVYNTFNDTWSIATAKTGTEVSGGRLAITGNTIIYVGGYSQKLARTLADALEGVIDPLNPLSITWSFIPEYPGGPTGRLAAGVTAEQNGMVYFGGGDPNGSGADVLNTVYAFNTLNDQWEIGPSMIKGVSNICSFSGIIHQDTLYLATIGGYDGNTILSAHEWLKIGAAAIPAVSPDTTICLGDSASLHATNGTSYTWSQTAGLNDPHIASPKAAPTVTTTYTVNIGRTIGCALNKIITVTVNPLPVISTTADTAICSGDTAMIAASGGNSYLWLPATGLDNNTSASPQASPTATTTYTVTAKDVAGCANTDSVHVDVKALPPADAGNSTAIYPGKSTTLSGSGGSSFSWSPASGLNDPMLANPTATPSATTSYTLTVQDADGCMNSDSVLVTVNPIPVLTLTKTDALCYGISNGTATVITTGNNTYLWSSNASDTTSNVDSLKAGTYSVTVTDKITACASTGTVTITEPPALSLTTINDSTTSCNGTVQVYSSGGTVPYSYLWSDGSAQTTAAASNLCPGTYTVVVTDANKCTETATAQVLLLVSIQEEFLNSIKVHPNPAQESITITGSLKEDTRFSLVNVLGETVLTIKADANSNFTRTIDISMLPAGLYFLQLIGIHGIGLKKIIIQ